MNNKERFEQLWIDYLEGELHEDGIAELQQLLASDDSLLRAAADSFQVHRLLGLKVEDSETRHEDFVRATMGQLPSSETEFVGDVMQMLPVRRTGKPFSHVLFRGLVAAVLLLLVVLLFFRTSASPEVARITSLHGTVQWTGEGGIVQELDKIGEVLRGGTLETQSADAWAGLTYRDGTTVTVSGRSLLTLSEQKKKIIRLRYGNISANVAPQPTGRPMLVLTPSAELNVLGTQFNVDAQPESTRLVVNEGRVRLKRNADGKEVDVEAQHEITTSIAHQDGLMPVQRAVAISDWKSDLESDVVYGKWVPQLTALVLELKEAVAVGRMTKTEAVKAFKNAVTLDDTEGSVWAMPSSVGSLIVLSVSRSTATPVVLSPTARLRVRGRLHSQATVEFGLSVYEPNGGFAGKVSKSLLPSVLSGNNGTFDVVLPIRELEKVSDVVNSLAGRELRDCWCLVKSGSRKMEVSSVELIQE